MENKPTFDKMNFAKMIMQCFVISYISKGNVAETYARLRDKADHDIKMYSTDQNYQEKQMRLEECRKIIERCRDFFKNISLKKAVDQKIATLRAEVGDTLTSSQIAENLLLTFSDEFWTDGKRTYNMSHLATKGNIPYIKTSQGKMVPAVNYVPFENSLKYIGPDKEIPIRPRISLKDRQGNPISIEYLGTLYYIDGMVPNEYVYKYHIQKTINGVSQDYEVFSDFAIVHLETDPQLCAVVVSELLSTYNIEHSCADGYIGDIKSYKSPNLNVGEEKDDDDLYMYQATPRHLLEYNGRKIEAIRAYKERLAIEHPQADEKPAIEEGPDKGEEPDI